MVKQTVPCRTERGSRELNRCLLVGFSTKLTLAESQVHCWASFVCLFNYSRSFNSTWYTPVIIIMIIVKMLIVLRSTEAKRRLKRHGNKKYPYQKVAEIVVKRARPKEQVKVRPNKLLFYFILFYSKCSRLCYTTWDSLFCILYDNLFRPND